MLVAAPAVSAHDSRRAEEETGSSVTRCVLSRTSGWYTVDDLRKPAFNAAARSSKPPISPLENEKRESKCFPLQELTSTVRHAPAVARPRNPSVI
jgi:hypothetical protein